MKRSGSHRHEGVFHLHTSDISHSAASTYRRYLLNRIWGRPLPAVVSRFGLLPRSPDIGGEHHSQCTFEVHHGQDDRRTFWNPSRLCRRDCRPTMLRRTYHNLSIQTEHTLPCFHFLKTVEHPISFSTTLDRRLTVTNPDQPRHCLSPPLLPKDLQDTPVAPGQSRRVAINVKNICSVELWLRPLRG